MNKMTKISTVFNLFITLLQRPRCDNYPFGSIALIHPAYSLLYTLAHLRIKHNQEDLYNLLLIIIQMYGH